MGKIAKHEAAADLKIIRNTKTGEAITVRGAGALKGKLALKKGVDLTKPIASQALRGGRSSASTKH